MFQQINVTKEVTADIQRKDVARQTAQDVVKDLVDAHVNDTDGSFIQSPVFKALQKDAEDKRVAWEQAKDSMVMQFIPAETQSKVKNWGLDYGTSVLTIEL